MSARADADAAVERDEEAWAEALPADVRLAHGAFFTPAPLVERVLSLVRAHLPETGPTAVLDPACGSGSFLAAADRAFPLAQLSGLELLPEAAADCARRVPRARIWQGDALRGSLQATLSRPSAQDFELWLGNPPYNGTSSVLRDPAAYARLCALFPGALPRGTSLRDDFAFFLLLAAERLRVQPGALAFITSATLLDAFLYGPVRQHLLERLALREVVDLGAGAFRGTRVRTCITVWTSLPTGGRRPVPRFHAADGEVRDFEPQAPTWSLRPAPRDAAALDEVWSAEGEPLDVLVPQSFTGLKTRFDELLVDDSRERLEARVHAFLATPQEGLPAFAAAWGLPSRVHPKLVELGANAREAGVRFDPHCVRPFFRYAGARHRDGIPPGERAWCYLERRLIPRGDHRMRGTYDPHAGPVKLVFNVRELPLSALVLESAGCLPAHRHARFAPLEVPLELRRPEGPWKVNLSPRGLAAAERLGGPLALFRALARFIHSAPVQELWAPAFGASRVLPVPIERLQTDGTLEASAGRVAPRQAAR